MLWQVERETNLWGLTRRAIPGGPKLVVRGGPFVVGHLWWAETGGPIGSKSGGPFKAVRGEVQRAD